MPPGPSASSSPTSATSYPATTAPPCLGCPVVARKLVACVLRLPAPAGTGGGVVRASRSSRLAAARRRNGDTPPTRRAPPVAASASCCRGALHPQDAQGGPGNGAVAA